MFPCLDLGGSLYNIFHGLNFILYICANFCEELIKVFCNVFWICYFSFHFIYFISSPGKVQVLIKKKKNVKNAVIISNNYIITKNHKKSLIFNNTDKNNNDNN